jgi:hypothetical protein
MNSSRLLWTVGAVVVVVAISGCTITPTFTERSTGQMYSGRTTGAMFNNDGRIEVNIDGENFSGNWTYMPGGTAGSSSSTLGGSKAGFGSGKGLANLRGEKGSSLRCVFEFNSSSATGIGECMHGDGRVFDVTMRM